jgi:hypothetical protein
MPAIMADHDIEGQVRILLRLLTSAAWFEVWHELAIRVELFASLGLPENTSDATLWQFCQTQQIMVAPQLTVVRCPCDTIGGPAILL